MIREDNITIPRHIFNQMERDQKELRALEAAGVDNWEGYMYAMDILREDEE